MRKALVILVNIIFVVPMLALGFFGMALNFIGDSIEDWFTYTINPIRSEMYRWAWKRGVKK